MSLVSPPVAGDSVIPYRLSSPHLPLLVVAVKVNGEGPYEFIVDLGNAARALIISPALAEHLNLRTRPTTLKQGFPIGLNKQLDVGELSSFQLGDIRTGAIEVGVSTAITQLSKVTGNKIDGNVGYGFFKNYTVSFFPQKSVLILSRHRATGLSVPITIPRGKPLVVVNLQVNDVPMNFVLDTGASYCCVSEEAAKSLNLRLGQEVPLNQSKSDMGHLTTIGSLAIGQFRQRQVGAVASNITSALTKATGIHIDGVLGYNFWGKYNLTVDYPAKTLLLAEPGPK